MRSRLRTVGSDRAVSRRRKALAGRGAVSWGGAMRRSQELFDRAQRYIPGGVNSPVRSFRSVGGTPPFIVRGRGAYVTSADGRRYLDYLGSWGALLLGHAEPSVVRAVRRAAQRGTSFGAPTPGEVELAQLITRLVPSIDQVRLVNSGTEAVMSAVRVARAATGRDLIIKFAGGYHGHADHLLVDAGSGAASLGVPSSAGVPSRVAGLTLVVPYNDSKAVRRLVHRHHGKVAAVLVEPIAGNMGVVPPQDGFLRGLRVLCDAERALLIFDEVITGFRVALGGAQALYGVRPDLTCLGKIIGGGLPVGAYGGRRDLMSRVAPSGPVYQAGTLAGNPVAVAAGLAMLQRLVADPPYRRLEHLTLQLCRAVEREAQRAGVSLVAQRVGSMFTWFMGERPPRNEQDVRATDAARFSQFFHAMLAEGVYLAPSPFEANFLSTAHGDREVERTIRAARRAFRNVRG